MYDTGLYNAGYYSSNERHRECVVDVELERRINFVLAVVWQDVQELAYEIQGLASNVRDLEYRTDALADELSSSVYTIFTVLDEDRNLARAWGLEDFGELGKRLLQNLRRTDVNLGDDNHNRNVQRQRD